MVDNTTQEKDYEDGYDEGCDQTFQWICSSLGITEEEIHNLKMDNRLIVKEQLSEAIRAVMKKNHIKCRDV